MKIKSMQRVLYSIIVLIAVVLFGRAVPVLAAEVPDGSFENFDDTWECDLNCTVTVYLLNPSTNEVYTQETFTEQSDTWITGALDIPAALQGQTVRLYITN